MMPILVHRQVIARRLPVGIYWFAAGALSLAMWAGLYITVSAYGPSVATRLGVDPPGVSQPSLGVSSQ